MSEVRNDNPETKSPSSEVSQPESAKASEVDKNKLIPQENKVAKTDDSYNGKNEKENKPGHPKLEANSNDMVLCQDLVQNKVRGFRESRGDGKRYAGLCPDPRFYALTLGAQTADITFAT